jgi:putative hydrolase
MRFLSDFHTHTTYSHGKGSIEDNVLYARKIGLKKIGITDHGPMHMGFGIKEKAIIEMRREVDELNKKYDDIEILLGIEANVLNEDGDLDCTDLILKNIDILIAGYHFGSNPVKFLRDMGFHGRNRFKSFSSKIYDKAKIANTSSFVNAMNRYNIDIISHPGAKGPIDVEKVATAAKQTETALEINNKHGHLTIEEIIIAKKFDVKFSINSDAHKPEDVGNVKLAIERAVKAGLTEEDIIN